MPVQFPATRIERAYISAKGTFSLPVELPQGEVELAFARPGGDAELEVLVVREGLLGGLEQTGGLFVVLALLWLIVMLVRHAAITSRKEIAGFIAPFVLLAALMLWMVGLMGLFAVAVLIIVVELLRRLIASRRAARAAG